MPSLFPTYQMGELPRSEDAVDENAVSFNLKVATVAVLHSNRIVNCVNKSGSYYVISTRN